MDLLELIRDKCNSFSDPETAQGLVSVISHIEIAERHLDRGKKGEDYLFTDAIYRTNQAFEGSLKEAYRVLTGNQPGKLTPFKIEQYFVQNSILKERVLFFLRITVKNGETNQLTITTYTFLSRKHFLL